MSKKLNSIIIMLVAAALIFEGFNIYLSNRLATESIEASQLKRDIALVEQENNVLQSEIFEHSSFESVASRAAEFGFQKAKESISISSPVTVALD
jgi:cell division protein FtsL